MNKDIPRAAIHVGDDKKTFSAAKGAEAERRGWDEQRYHLKNLEKEKNNHYDFSRKKLNFEITKGGAFSSLGSNPVPLHERLQKRHDELGFKPYMDKDHPNVIADNSPNGLVEMIFSGDHDTLYKLAFGNQKVNVEDNDADNSDAHLEQGIKDWALDTYRFCCRKWGEENIIGFCVHCDETSIHIHVLTVPVEKVKKRGRATFAYVRNDDPSVSISNKEWKKLPSDEQSLYTRTEKGKDLVERVSYAKVWGESSTDKSAYLSQLHTDYHEEVGCKYGLERGFSEDELSDEERRERKHKSKVQLEAERQAKLAIAKCKEEKEQLDKENVSLKMKNATLIHETEQVWHEKDEADKALEGVKKYAALAVIDQKELRFPLLNLTKPVKDAKNSIAKELSIPIPVILGQKAWREERITNLNAIIETLIAEVNRLRDVQNDGVRKAVNREHTYHMQQLNKLIKENQSLSVENNSVKKENAEVKKRISELDENAVARVTKEKDAVIFGLNNRIGELNSKLSTVTKERNDAKTCYSALVDKYNALWREPEMVDAWKAVKIRKAAEELEAKRQERLMLQRKEDILNKFIAEGQQTQRDFALSSRYHFNDSEASCICCGIIALAIRDCLSLNSDEGIKNVTGRFLNGCNWSGMLETRISCCMSWTNIFTSTKADFSEDITTDFATFVDHMSCSQDTYESLMGSNGCADQLTNWDGTQKQGLGENPNRKPLTGGRKK